MTRSGALSCARLCGGRLRLLHGFRWHEVETLRLLPAYPLN